MIVLVETQNEKRLVVAKTKRQAIEFVVSGSVSAKSLTAEELLEHMNAGMKVEDATLSTIETEDDEEVSQDE